MIVGTLFQQSLWEQLFPQWLWEQTFLWRLFQQLLLEQLFPQLIAGTTVPTKIVGTNISLVAVPTTFLGTVVSTNVVGTTVYINTLKDCSTTYKTGSMFFIVGMNKKKNYLGRYGCLYNYNGPSVAYVVIQKILHGLLGIISTDK